MLYLVVAVLASLVISVVFKLSASKPTHRYSISFFCDLAAVVISLAAMGKQTFFRPSWVGVMLDQAPAVFGSMGRFDEAGSAGFALCFGFVFGGMIFYAIYVMQLSTAKNGAAMTTTFNKVSSVLPAVLAVIFFGEVPGTIQTIAIVLAMVAIIMVYVSKEAGTAVTKKAALLGTFLCGGLGDFAAKIFQQYGQSQHYAYFILVSYLVGCVASGFAAAIKERAVSKWDILFGLLAGIPLAFVSRFLMLSLNYLPSYIVFPTYAAANIILINLINLIFFKEKLSRRQFSAIGIMGAAIVMMNL